MPADARDQHATPCVSVLMPVYNAATTLAKAVDSILAQTEANFELLAVDNGSTDDTLAMLQAYAARDSRVWPVPLPHGGIVAALNHGLTLARGRYVARMDGDDWSHPERLAAQRRMLDADAALGLVSCRVQFGGDGAACAGYAAYVDWINTLVSHEAISANRFRESPLAHPSVMFRRELVARHGGYREGPFPEDYELWLRWLEAGVRMAKHPEALLTWNDPPSRLSRTHANYAVDAFYALKTEALAQWLARHNPHHPGVHIIGAGQVSRKRARRLLEHGIRIVAWVDIDPKKIGQCYGGVPVISREALPPPGECFVLSYVASRDAHQIIMEFLQARGFVAGRNCLLAA
ncbi:glycosyltransferase [Megalodesulfovibrio paquesii]